MLVLLCTYVFENVVFASFPFGHFDRTTVACANSDFANVASTNFVFANFAFANFVFGHVEFATVACALFVC